jgi:FAD/FMN-containing dehydrogenase
MKAPRPKLWRKILCWLALLLFLLAMLAARPTIHIARALWNDCDDIVAPPPPGTADDASRLSETKVREVWPIPSDRLLAESQLADLLRRARTNHLKVSIAGARHSMGAHTIADGGIVVDMLPFNRMELDTPQKVLRVQAGARWREVIRFLNAQGLSVEIMQSNDDFTVGGSLSVNCHGWQFNRPPIASSVESLRLMRADGTVVICSRTENRELFSLALGGYGLVGIILDVKLRVVPNERYRMQRTTVATKDFATTIAAQSSNTNIAMIYGRLNVAAEGFLGEGILNVLRRQPNETALVTEFRPRKLTKLKRAVFRGSVGDDYGKRLRWRAEQLLDPWLSGDVFERNALLSESATWFENRCTDATDILMECFVPPAQFEPFLAELRQIIPRNQADLLNLTVRQVNQDRDSFLGYADREMFALVMLFHHNRDAAGEARMKITAQEIIAAALAHEGRYYLPYRSHATAEQFASAYPQAEQFFTLKRKYDPEGRFENGFSRSYGK